ncbi:hypothetical protein [Saccharibacillus sacchari]|uniref:Uncharacterized protein n=1 Tax=Saccharibacillus sacchari TaxID=456493 RepID=A0ACC6P5X3_9BACL
MRINRIKALLLKLVRIFRKMVMISILAVVLLVAAVFSLYIVFPIWNNVHLYTFAHQLKKVPMPEDTVFVEMETTVGKLNGNGNGIDFFAAMLVKSELGSSELFDYYKAASFTGAKSDEHKVAIGVSAARGDELKSQYVEREKLKFHKLRSTEDFSGYYVVTLYDGGYEALFDLRGN